MIDQGIFSYTSGSEEEINTAISQDKEPNIFMKSQNKQGAAKEKPADAVNPPLAAGEFLQQPLAEGISHGCQ